MDGSEGNYSPLAWPTTVLQARLGSLTGLFPGRGNSIPVRSYHQACIWEHLFYIPFSVPLHFFNSSCADLETGHKPVLFFFAVFLRQRCLPSIGIQKSQYSDNFVTRPFCLVESHILKTLLRAGVLCFTAFVFCTTTAVAL